MPSNLARIQELTTSVNKFYNALEGFMKYSLDGILIVNEKGQIELANERWHQILGITPKEMQGRSFFDFVCPEDIEKTKKEFQEMRDQNRQALEFKNHWQDSDGNRVCLVWNTSAPVNGKYYSIARVKTYG